DRDDLRRLDQAQPRPRRRQEHDLRGPAEQGERLGDGQGEDLGDGEARHDPIVGQAARPGALRTLAPRGASMDTEVNLARAGSARMASAIITGSNRGTGAGIAQVLRAAGYRVVGWDRTAAPESDTVACDVRDPDQVGRAAQGLPPDLSVVVANAG